MSFSEFDVLLLFLLNKLKRLFIICAFQKLVLFLQQKYFSIEGEYFSSANNVKLANFSPLKGSHNPRKMQRNYMTSEDMLEELRAQEKKTKKDMI